MHFPSSFLLLLSLVAAASAYQVTVPNTSQGWTNNGPQTLTWQRVDTDQANFTAVLVNQDPALYPSPGYQQVLDALVVGSLGTIKVNPPSAGWPSGPSFQVNLVRDAQSLDAILAQSQKFNINATTGSTTPVSTPTGTTFVAPPSTTTDLNPSESPAFTSSGAALPEMATPGGLLGIAAFAISFFLA